MNEIKKECSDDEELLVCTSYRYCIGRKTYVSCLANYIAKEYYNRLSDARLSFIAEDIRRCICDTLRYATPSFEYDGIVSNSERIGLPDYVEWINTNITDEKDFLNIETVVCTKDSYSSTEKKYYTRRTEGVNKALLGRYHYQSDIDDLLCWNDLASFFDKKNYVNVTVKDRNGEMHTYVCFETVRNVYEPIEGAVYCQLKPWKYKKAYVIVDDFLTDARLVIADEAIINIEKINN